MLRQRNSPSFLRGIIQRFFGRGVFLSPELAERVPHIDKTMKAYSEHEQEEMAHGEAESLLCGSYTVEEINAWTLLRDHYQHGGSDRVPLLRRLEFLKLLVQTGKIER